MRFDLTLALVDRPGQLLKALEPIAKNGGNIISIIHEREKTAGLYVPVSVVVDFPAYENFKKAREDLEKIDVTVVKSEEVIEKANLTVILVGRFDFKKVLEAKIKGLRIINFEVSAPTSKECCIKLNIEVPTELVDEALKELKRLSQEENAILVSSI